jgi:DUF1680 family protein
LEAACWSIASGEDEQTQNRIAEVIQIISAAQDKDGYLNTYFAGEKESERWSNLRDMHELYCAGHLIQAAIAHHRVTGKEDLLSVVVDLADHICRRFLDTGLPATSGHPEIEMALVELYRSIGDRRYLQMAQSFLDQRGNGLIGGLVYHLDQVPFRKMIKLEGHAVRAMYLCCGATDIYLETGESLLIDTVKRLWDHMVSRQMYISGGIGSRHQGESLGGDFELPNARAYAETCAAIGSILWNWRLLHVSYNPKNSDPIQPEVKYADLIEWTLYNAVLPGIGLNGHKYHYVNPLEVHDSHLRQDWFDCACCPTNIVRLIASIGGYCFSHSEDSIWIHQYTASQVEVSLNDDLTITFTIKTEYPWSGEIEIEVTKVVCSDTPIEANNTIYRLRSFGVNLRIPTWLHGNIPVFVNNKLWKIREPGSYLNIFREWMIGDKIKIEMPMPIRFIECHPFVHENSGRIAMSRGPLLYCIEAHDNKSVDPRELYIKLDNASLIQPVRTLSSGITGIQVDADVKKIDRSWMHSLYRERAHPNLIEDVEEQSVFAIPYFSWGNRSEGWMQVWIKRK